jgi:predicted RND superfamily exporter protein
LFGIFAVLTLIGIGVDYGIHLVHRARTDELESAVARIVPANLVAAGIALLGCGSLVTSSYPPLRSLGILTVVGLVTCLIAAVIVLPAMLMSAPSRDRERSAKP